MGALAVTTVAVLPLTLANRARAQGRTGVVTPSAAGESALGAFVADALRSATGADAALVPTAAFKSTDLAPGPHAPREVLDSLILASDTVVVLDVSGDALRAAIERGVSNLP
jgi:hypothetical protein